MIKGSSNETINFSSDIGKYSILEFFFWATFAAYYPYLMVFLDSKGLSNYQIGTIFATNSFIILLAQPLWGMVSDRIQSIKKIFIILLSITIILIGSLPFYNGAIPLGIILAIITFFESALVPLLDSWVIMGIRNNTNISYGNIRLWGSIGFALMVYIFGKFIAIKGVWILSLCFASFGILTILICLRITVNNPPSTSIVKNLKIIKLLKNYDYISFLLFAIVIFLPHKAAFIFLPRLIESIGGNTVLLGSSLSIMALSEVPIFLFSKKLINKIKPIELILFSSIFFILRQILLSIATSPADLILIQALQGPSFALFLTGTVYYIDSLAPQELKATAQTVAAALYSGISGIIGSYGGGWIIDQFGLISLYHIGIFLSLIITILFILSLYLRKKSESL